MQKRKSNTTLIECVNKKIIETFETGGMAVLPPMNLSQIEESLEIIKKYPELAYGTITIDGMTYVVLKSKKFKELNYNESKKALQAANRTYAHRDYQGSIDFYLQALKISQPKGGVYGRLGVSYLRNQELEKAINCFIIAEFLSQHKKKKKNYRGFLRYAENLLMEEEDYKPECIVDISTFDDSDYYGIDNFPLIDDYIMEMMNEGKSLEEACFSLNIGLQEINIIYLIYARRHYLAGLLHEGDALFLTVEKRKNKTKKVIDIMNEIRARRKFYQYSNIKAQDDEKAYTLNPIKKWK